MKYLVTDQDGTLILESPFTEVAKKYGFFKENLTLVNQYMMRELSYEQLIRLFIDSLVSKRADRDTLETIFRSLTPVHGLTTLLERIDGKGLAVLSGGFLEVSRVHGVLDKFKEHYGVRLIYSQEEVVIGGVHFEGTSVGKLSTLRKIISSNGLSLREICYLGDSGNDYLVARELVENGGTFLMVEPKENRNTDHPHKKDESDVIDELRSIASKVISTLEEVIPFIE